MTSSASPEAPSPSASGPAAPGFSPRRPELQLGRSAFSGLATLEPVIDQCVHCGFCLPACPSYLLLNQEMDSPRGRIYLMKAGVDDRVSVTDAFVRHFDSCLGCMACETACPSGVRYAPLIEETRAAIERHHRRSFGDRLFRSLLFHVLPHSSRLRVLSLPMGLARWARRAPRLTSWLPERVHNLIALAPDVNSLAIWRTLPERTAPAGVPRLRVGLLTGCVQRVFFGHVNEATTRILAAEGCEVVAPSSQGCCGALALHAGRDDDARAFARALIQTFETTDVSQIVVNAAGCGSTMKSYGALLDSDPAWAERGRSFAAKVRDATETLAGLGAPRSARHSIDMRVAYHDACHLAHAQGVRREPRALLTTIPGLTLVPLAENDICCGSAGIFNLVQPAMARELGRRKAARIAESEADAVVTSNPGCILQIQAAGRANGRQTRVFHVMELIDASLSGRAL